MIKKIDNRYRVQKDETERCRIECLEARRTGVDRQKKTIAWILSDEKMQLLELEYFGQKPA